MLAFVVPYYGRLVASVPAHEADQRRHGRSSSSARRSFYVLAQFGVPLGMIYFVWIGIFNLMIVAQFWSFANDVYSKEEGERLLVIVGLGASLGAVAGARVADRLIEPFGVLQLMLLGAGVLGAPAAAHQLHRPRSSAAAGRPPPRVKKANAAPAAERVRDGVQDAVSAADGADDPADQLDQHDRRVHPRQHRQGTRRRRWSPPARPAG